MHKTSIYLMKHFITKYLNPKEKIEILDVGSCEKTGAYRKLCAKSNWKYTGLDITGGPNVDVVAKGPYTWGLSENYFDVVISGQCLEHVEDIKEWAKQIPKVLKKGGLVCLIAPWTWIEHRHPVDCWRVLPDGMKFILVKVCNFELLESHKKKTDCMGIARKVI